MSFNRRCLLSSIGAVSLLSTAKSTPAHALTSSPYRLIRSENEVFPNTCWGAFRRFRIPSLLRTPSGRLLAFCEGRFRGVDYGDTDILVKYSPDGGVTWQNTNSLNRNINSNSCDEYRIHKIALGLHEVETDTSIIPKTANWRNPTSVMVNNRIFLFVAVDEGGEPQSDIQKGRSKFTSRFFFIVSNSESEWETDGIDWSSPREIFFPHSHRWGAFGPGNALYVKGRIIVPVNTNHTEKRINVTFCLISDDEGENWSISGYAGRSTENQLAHIRDDIILMSKRANDSQEFFISEDRGDTWNFYQKPTHFITTPAVQTSLFMDKRSRLCLAGPNNHGGENDSEHRIDMSLWTNDDLLGSAEWSNPLPLEPDTNRCRTTDNCKNWNSYSCISDNVRDELVVLYEDSKEGNPETRIVVATLSEHS